MTPRSAHESFDGLIWAAAAWIYGGPDTPAPAARRGVFRVSVVALAAVLLAVILRHHALPEAWHRIGYALWLVAATVAMRGESLSGSRTASRAAALGLALAIGFVAWLAILRG